MATYCPARGGARDGLCGCGAPATTEIQVGWFRSPPSGGQYQEVCKVCHAYLTATASETAAWKWAVAQQGYTGTYVEWLALPADDRAEYEAGAAGIPTS